MPIDTRINIPFIPQEGITSQILSAISLANEQHFHQQQIANQQQQTGIQQQNANTAASKAPSEIEEAKARTGLYGVQAQHQQMQVDNMRRAQQMFSTAQPAEANGPPSVQQQVQMYPGSDLASAVAADPTFAAKEKWLPSNTPPQLAPILSAMIPQDLTDQEKNIVESGAQTGRMQAMGSGNLGEYLDGIRKGIDSVVTARNSAAKPEGERALGTTRVDQLNDGMRQRWAVLNPDQALPASFLLPATATQKDFDHIDKLLEATEKAHGTKAQQDTANAIRKQTEVMAQDKADINPVTGTDKNGNDVLVPSSDAKKMGLTNVMKADADLVNKSQAARHWLKLADKEGSTPDTMGILQLIDKLDKEDKLGPVASRWNEFMAGKVGSGDPEVAALRAKMGLSTTKLMQAHVGSRGGAFLLEHFEDLANAKKMDGPTLKAGIESELDYMKDVAMLPGGGGKSKASAEAEHLAGGAAQGLQEGATGTGSDGKPYIVKGGVWVPQTK